MKERDRLGLLKQPSSAAMLEEKEEGKVKKRKGPRKKPRLSELGWFARKLSQAGINVAPRLYVILVLLGSTVFGLLLSFIGIIVAVSFGAALAYHLLFSYLEERAVKRKKIVVPQLAPFIDGIASALGTGFNIEGAIVQAAEGVPPGLLKDELDRIVRALNAGFTVKEATTLLKERITGKEVTALAVSLTLFASMGGHVLEPFRRLARKIREQEGVADKANRDLVMVKQAFYIIFFLALSAPFVMMVVQPSYLNQAFSDVLGRIILQGGAIMVLISFLCFKKITNLKL